MESFAIVLRSFLNALFFIVAYWWIYLPVLLVIGVVGIYRNYTETKYRLSLKWVLLEIKPPLEVVQSPKVAENFFSGLHGVYSIPVKGKKHFIEGKIQDWYSLEIVGNQGDVRFYVRTLESNRNLVETHLFAQYPGAEISLVDDYISQFPEKVPLDEYDLFGTELVFTKNDAYPLKTYPFFEEEGGKDEYKRIDPLAPLAETMSALGPGEYMWLQYVIRPTGDEWTKESAPEINKITGKKEEKKEDNVLLKAFDAISALLPFVPGKTEQEKKEEKEFTIQRLTSGQKFILDQIENKIAKLAFKVTPRFMYLAKKDVFNRARTTSVIGMFKQLYSNNLNTFKPNNKTATFIAPGFLPWLFPSDKGFFARQQEFEHKADMWNYYRWRAFRKVVILSTEELATVFHLPGQNVKAPSFPRVEAKKGQPPAGLPMK